MMKVLLVFPPVCRLEGVRATYYPLGLGYLAALTNRMGIPTKIYNAEFEEKEVVYCTTRERLAQHSLVREALANDDHPVWVEYRRVLGDIKPDLVGFSCTSASIMQCLKMARIAKDACGAKTVFGGMHPTILPRETLAYPDVDYVVVGNAERSFLALIKGLADGDGDSIRIPGVGVMRNNAMALTQDKTRDIDIDEIPFPDRDALVNFDVQKKYLGALIASRGCPYKCTFCSGKNLTNRKVRYRNVQSIVREMHLLKEKYSMSYLTFYDDAFVVNRTRVHELCEQIIREKLGINWSAFARADSLDEETLKVMRRSGCTDLGLGVESGSDKVLARMCKGYTRSEAIAGIKLIRRSGITPAINIIVGLPYETIKDVEDTIRLVKELGVVTNINTFTPYPNTELFDECVSLGMISGEIDWSLYSQHSIHNQFVHAMTIEEYRKVLNEMVSVVDEINAKWRTQGHRYREHLRKLYIGHEGNALSFALDIGKRLLRRGAMLLSR